LITYLKPVCHGNSDILKSFNRVHHFFHTAGNHPSTTQFVLSKEINDEQLEAEDSCPNKNHDDSWVLVAHTCNPSDSESIDQEDHGSNPAWANSLWTLS
jgi:hypothetical protein